jgi:S1-C subfamily serine protease
VGDTVTLTVLRDNKEVTVEVVLEARPAQELQRSQSDSGSTSGTWLGIQGLTLTPEIAQAMDLSADQAGVLVEQVIQDSPAHAAGLRGSYKPLVLNGQLVLIGGDVITAVDGQAVTAAGEITALVQQAEPGQTMDLTVLRSGQSIEVQVTLTESPTSSSTPG